ncbi:major facilitator superfamily domain-containing protein [Tricharina praecox]|uniref:major facilitator superfamily domain-containing protein n=1 Tax=Tricharina praecox TaxID=43433 RepID=UPI00221E46C0|nr:major facilitator superfamily domain-containing protein [Tricharina praecox]KAI5855417.1 major facilitator superfamily domain-containing protein [Tricharina praecox]
MPLPIPYLPALLLLLSELSELLLVSPRIRLLESSICRTHYGLPSVPEAECKIPDVQRRLAYIRGWQVFFEATPVMALAIPWGALADRVGRKKVLAVNFVGCAIHIAWFALVCNPGSNIAIEWVWASALAFVLGGGPRTAGILILALVNDVSPGAERSERFYYTYSAFLVTELVALPLASVLMQKSIMLPFVIALLSLGCCFPVLGMIKGRRAQGQLRTSGDEATAGLLETTTGEDNGVATTAGSKKPWTLRVLLQDLWKVVADIDASTALVLLGHFICPVRQELVFQILIPYTSKRFELPIANAGLLLSVVAFTNLAIFISVLPYITRRLRRTLSPSRIDTLTASYSSLLLALGSLMIGFAGTFPLLVVSTITFSAGFGIRLGLLSLLTALVDPAKIGRAYTLVTVVESFGEMTSAPMLQGLWSWGLLQGGVWRGTPWWAGAVVYLAGWWWIERVRVKGERRRVGSVVETRPLL